MTSDVSPEVASAFWNQVRERHPGRARIEADKMLPIASSVVRQHGLSLNAYVFMSLATRALAQAGHLTLPSDRTPDARRKNYDGRCRPAFPVFVTVVQTVQRTASPARLQHPWHPDLAFLASQSSLRNEDVWLALDGWLKAKGSGTDVMAMRERSYEIFGNEKKFEEVRNYRAFDAGLITLEHFRCEETPEPLVARVYQNSATRSALIVENKDTFRSACIVNAEYRHYAAVVFGEGAAFPGRVEGLALVSDAVDITEIDYFGDIDAEGFKIARQASVALSARGQPYTFHLATHLYRCLLSCGKASGSFGQINDEVRAFLSDHQLPEMDLEPLGRIPQEALNRPLLRQSFAGWRT
jgi:hypothetical protein